MRKIVGVSKSNFYIYLIGTIISVVLIGLYFISPNCSWYILSCSIGASGVGACILAYLVERSNNKLAELKANKIKSQSLHNLSNSIILFVASFIKSYFMVRERISEDITNSESIKLSNLNEISNYFINLENATIINGADNYDDIIKNTIAKVSNNIDHSFDQLKNMLTHIENNQLFYTYNEIFTFEEFETLNNAYGNLKIIEYAGESECRKFIALANAYLKLFELKEFKKLKDCSALYCNNILSIFENGTKYCIYPIGGDLSEIVDKSNKARKSNQVGEHKWNLDSRHSHISRKL